jgi:acyl dehydratase
MTMRYYEDIELGETGDFGSITLSRAEITEFARKYDPLPFHLETGDDAESVFDGVVASGIQTIGVCQRQMAENFYEDAAVMGGPGIENARMMNPVYPGDELSVRFEVTDKRPLESRPELGLIELTQIVTDQDGDPVLEMITTPFFKRRPDAET